MVTFNAMPKAHAKRRPGRDQGNAIENETREAESRERESRERGVTEEESTLADEYPGGGESGGKKY